MNQQAPPSTAAPSSDTAQSSDAAFLADFHFVATIGATYNNGVDRQALTPEDKQTRDWMRGWATDKGFDVRVDAVVVGGTDGGDEVEVCEEGHIGG